jgi:hypothetical protein
VLPATSSGKNRRRHCVWFQQRHKIGVQLVNGLLLAVGIGPTSPIFLQSVQ